MAHKKIGTRLASDIAEKIAKKAFEHLIPVLEEQLREIGREAYKRIDDDVGAFFAPTVARQIMTANAEASSDLRMIAVGGRRRARAVMRMFPATILAFDRLLEALLQRSSRSWPWPP